MAKNEVAAKKSQGLESRLKPTSMNHIFFLDVEGDNRLREVAVSKIIKDHEGRIVELRYIDIALLDAVDKGRLKGIVTGLHADKYELWALLDQQRLNNGMMALDYFHQVTKILRGPGATNTALGGGLAGVQIERQAIVGSEFSDPESAVLGDGAL
jgi:hypothetical protein